MLSVFSAYTYCCSKHHRPFLHLDCWLVLLSLPLLYHSSEKLVCVSQTETAVYFSSGHIELPLGVVLHTCHSFIRFNPIHMHFGFSCHRYSDCSFALRRSVNVTYDSFCTCIESISVLLYQSLCAFDCLRYMTIGSELLRLQLNMPVAALSLRLLTSPSPRSVGQPYSTLIARASPAASPAAASI